MTVGTWQRDQRPQNNDASSKKTSPVGAALKFMYKPRIGKNINEINQAAGVFPRLLAHIFAAQGLFPLSHPALRDDSMRLTMREVIATAYRHLDWNKEGMPKALFFFAVVASLAFSAIAFAYIILGFFVAPAHAGIFDNALGATDMSNKWLTYLFQTDVATPDFTVTMPNDAAAGTVTQTIGNGIPTAFRALAAMYSTGMLLLAALILIYHLIAMVVHTAHDGSVMGKSAHQIWAPVRLIFALGLLIPVANGFSSGQWLVLQIARLGSNMASNVWIDPNVGQRVTGQSNLLSTRPDLEADKMIQNLVQIGYCAKKIQLSGSNTPDLNGFLGTTMTAARTTADVDVVASPDNALLYDFTGVGSVSQPAQYAAVTAVVNGYARRQPVIAGAGTNAAVTSKIYYPVTPTDASLTAYTTFWDMPPCGTVAFPALANDGSMPAAFRAMLAGIAQSHADAFGAIEQNALSVGSAMAAAERIGSACMLVYGSGRPRSPCTGATAGASGIDVSNSIAQLKTDYLNTFTTVLPANAPGVAYNAGTGLITYVDTPTAAQAAAAVGNMGWMAAAGWFSTLASKHNAFGKAGQLVPSAHANCEKADCGEEVVAAAIQQEQKGMVAAALDYASAAASSLWDIIKAPFMMVLRFVGIYNNQNQLIWHTQFTSSSPVSDMVQMGSQLVDSAAHLVAIGIACNLLAAGGTLAGNMENLMANAGSGRNGVKGAVVSKIASAAMKYLPAGAALSAFMETIGGIAGFIAPLFFGLATMILLPGVFLFYILPFLPFLNFVTGCITWLISLLQAVVAIPVIAIAHITPHGEGLPSGAARGAYTMILQIFLRPVMMIFGMLATIMIMNTGIGFFNTVFFNIYKQNMIGNADGIFSNIIFMVMYAAGCWGIVNAAVTAIDDFPLKAVTWIGGGQGVDTNHDVKGVATLAAGAFGQQAINSAVGAANRISSAPAQSFGAAVNRNTQAAGVNASHQVQPWAAGAHSQLPGNQGHGAYSDRTGRVNAADTQPRPPGGKPGDGGMTAPAGGPTGPAPEPSRIIMPESSGGGPRTPMQQATMEAHRDGRAFSDVQTRQTFGASQGNTGGAASQGNAPFPVSSSRTASTPGGNVQPGARDAIRSAGGNNAPASTQRGQIEVPQRVGSGPRSQGQQATMEALREGRPFTSLGSRDAIINRVIDKYEGGARVVTDSGGLTKYGISQNAYPNLDIRNLTREQAVEIYRRDYWNRIGADNLPPEMRLMAFDTAVNQGVGKANHFISRSGGDVDAFAQMRADHYQNLAASNPGKYGQYLNGWMNRLGDVYNMSTGGAALATSGPAGIDPGAGEPEGGSGGGRGMLSGAAHTVLGLASFVPGLSVITGGIDAIIYTAEGDYGNAALAGVSMIPGGKWATSGFKLVRMGGKMLGGAGRLARMERFNSALSGSGSSSGAGTGAPQPVEAPQDVYSLLLKAKALQYIQSGGRKENTARA